MTPAIFIRKSVLRMTQEELAAALKPAVTQPTIHRWDRQGFFPGNRQGEIRAMAKARCSEFQDSWMFEVPKERPVEMVA